MPVQITDMRYWFNGEDEGYERERERVNRFGGSPPAPMSPLDLAVIALLVSIHAIALTGATVALVLWL